MEDKNVQTIALEVFMSLKMLACGPTKMAQQVKAFAAPCDNQLDSEAHLVEGENGFMLVILSDVYMYAHMCTYIQSYIQKYLKYFKSMAGDKLLILRDTIFQTF